MTQLLKGTGLVRFGLAGLLAVASAAAVRADGNAAANGATPTTGAPQVRLNAFAVNMSGVGRARTQQLEIVIDRWSSDAEHDQLLDVLKNKGSSQLLDALQSIRPRAGYIRTTTSLGWDIQFAREHPLPDGGRRIVFATDRPMSFFELRNDTRSRQYEFMLCEIRLDKDGNGDGKLATLAKVSYDKAKNQIEIENYGFEPVRLTQVEVEKTATTAHAVGAGQAGTPARAPRS